MKLIPSALLLAFSLTVARADLAKYVALPETAAKWTVKNRAEFGNCEVTQIDLVSQVWQGIEWKHDLVLFRPKDIPATDTIFLLNSGGRAKPEGLPYGVMLATKIKAPVAILLGIPNQPLFDNKREDDLIAETFVRYLETQDQTWPLLFPMVKSLVKAMDAVQEVSSKEWGRKVERFVVSGASKRGWTTWLTAASDSRVMAIAPMVIDVLNMPAQMERQVECFGGPSEQIRPYSARGLVPMQQTAEAKRLWSWVDPWTYRAKFTLPKLVVLGTNDRYWAPDALNLYWDSLPGEKWISYTPNAGHNLTEKKSDGSKDPMRAVDAVAAFTRHQITGKPLPKLSWNHLDQNGKMHLAITAEPAPKEVRVWRANGPTKDIRNATWESRSVEVKEGQIQIDEERPSNGVSAFFAELAYQIDDLPYSLCTQLRFVEAPSGAGK
ncbi:MAG TPA: PhoPQ-activated protein PqaA family protein [Chthoniobacteraceae bacterium]|nr:PhoPQ-activated protein PqaA family protein [Chthoniobacteraceae bacterium]